MTTTTTTIEPLLSLDDVRGVYVDALVQHRETGAMLFGSFWGRDTAVQELLARLSLPVGSGGLDALRLSGCEDPAVKRRLLIDAPERLAKLTGRMPSAGLFGPLVQAWLFVPLATAPDHAGRRALRLLRSGSGAAGDRAASEACQSEAAWALLKEVSHLPLLDEWREAMLAAALEQGWLAFHPGHGVDALEIDLGLDNRYELAVSGLIKAGRLRLPGEAPALPPTGATGTAPPQGGATPPVGPAQKPRLTDEELARELGGFTGTTQWYKHWLRKLLYTDGVQFFAEEGGQNGAYWFIDIVATEYHPMLPKHPFLLIRLIVADKQATILVENGNGKALKEKAIDYTDMQPGEWRFYLTDDVLLLPGEY